MDALRAMQLTAPHQPLQPVVRPMPVPQAGELLLKIAACGVCRTDLHIIDDEIPAASPIIPGHEIIGRIVAMGPGVTGLAPGQRVGVPWLGNSCGTCAFCTSGRENLCVAPVFTGCTRDGGYASHVVADARHCFPIPPRFGDAEAAPLLCAGAIGWRALRLAGPGRDIGLYGFGAAAHLLAQAASFEGRRVHAFARPGDTGTQDFARQLGCVWAGDATAMPPVPLDAAIIFAPAGELVPQALKAVNRGGRVVCAGIHMSDIPGFPYRDLWHERSVLSVANLTRADCAGFLAVADRAGIRPKVASFALADANDAIARVRNGNLHGAAVLLPEPQ
jgi:propanol-preferring alcohol dehydrogenase